MKLDLGRMLSAIAVSKGGPQMGKPSPSQMSVAVKKLAQKMVEEKMAEDEEEDDEEEIVTEKKMMPVAMEVMMSAQKGPEKQMRPSQTTYAEGESIVPQSGEELKKLLISEGIMMEKDGDYYMTPKGMEMKKKGLLKKYKMS